MNIVAEIDKYVAENKISRKKLATKAGISETQLSLSLGGRRKLLADEYIRICDALCVSYDKFVFRT